MHKVAAAMLLVLTAVGCAAPDPAVTELASKLAYDDMPHNASPTYRAYRAGYISCGEEALSGLPLSRIEAALKEQDSPSVWAVLGSEALDRYVSRCRKVDERRGPPPNA